MTVRDWLLRHLTRNRCHYKDCPNGYPLAVENERVTCRDCRKYLGLPVTRA